MTTQIQRRRGTTVQHSTFTGAEGEITIDTTKDTAVVHDGATAGGHPLAKEDGSTLTNVDINSGTIDGTVIGGTTPAAVTATSLTATGTTTLAGASTTADITFGDNDKAIFGAGSDLQIYHDGSNSYIKDAGTGDLYLQGSNNVQIESAAGANMIYATAGAQVRLFYDGSPKFNTTSTGIDVTGTVTADGLTVNSGTENLVATFQSTDAGAGVDFTDSVGTMRIENNSGNFQLYGNTTTYPKVITASSGGDISFYEDTGTTPKFFWDASAESLGIGTSSPSAPLTVQNTDGLGVDIVGQASDASQLRLRNQANTDNVAYFYASNTETQLGTIQSIPLKFTTSGSERMRIDSSGNLLVGNTTGALSTAGVSLRQNWIRSVRDGDIALQLNRLTSDGSIADFRKDGTTVGSIGSNSGTNLIIGTGDTGIYFNAASDAVHPWNISSNAARDNAINLGRSADRFKDLYLSGGVYLGGTGAANKLDDYEEGDHTTTITCSTFGTVTLNSVFNSLAYTKVGNLVTVQGLLVVSAVLSPSGYFKIGLPFTAASTPADRGGDAAGSILVQNALSANVGDFICRVNEGSATLDVYLGDSSTLQTDSAEQLKTSGGSTELYVSVTYRTA